MQSLILNTMDIVNPTTSDNIMTYLIIGGVSILCIVIALIVMKTKKK